MEIKIIDNFLDKIDLKRVINSTNEKSWMIQKSTPTRLDHLEFLYLDVTDDEFFNKYLFKQIEKHLDKKYDIARIYFNGQWPGRDGAFHKDDNGNAKMSVLFYVGEYKLGWGGFTEILTSPTEQKVIAPLQNRLVIFPGGDLMHKAYSFSHQRCPMRISLAYKLYESS